MKKVKIILSICLAFICTIGFAQTASDLRKAAEQGDATAQFNLGNCYHNGNGVKKDDSQAVYWYRKAAEQGDATAQFNLGLSYTLGNGVKKDYSQAVYWYRKAAEQGMARAQCWLGISYECGNGVKKDYSQAVYWYRKAVEQGNDLAQFNLGNCYHQGNGVKKDYSQAVYWYRKAAEQGYATAQLVLGALMYSSGDYKMSYQWLCKAKKNPNTSEVELAKVNGLLSFLEDKGFNSSNPIKTVSHSGHEYVDLGLSVKWATCNVGANSPEEYGSHFAWGETRPKSEYIWGNLKYRTKGDSDDNAKFSKYVTYKEYGPIDDKIRLDYSDDAARANWGGNWRMPTIYELQELIDKCSWTWTIMNGTNGYKVVSKSNGNSIFLPAAGFSSNVPLVRVGSHGYYWSRHLDSVTSSCARLLLFGSDEHKAISLTRETGLSVRPVLE